jgi:hypothetical protein
MNTKLAGESPSAEVVRLEPFTVEFGDLYCRNFTIACLHLRVRGAWSITRLHQRPIGGRDIGSAMSSMPAIPGQRLRIVPKELVAYLEDPLAEDPELLASINKVAQNARSIQRGAPWKAVPTTELRLSNDLLVTLILELHRKLEAGCIEVIAGRLPTIAQVQKIPGRELYDPWNNGRKPMYVDEVAGWQQRLEAAQGM